ncbi:MAG: hypothetical protein K2L73_01830 [Muribaculaceae bacterium]|nr:hypothetical protein [Muribaculaceae bacterium]
MTSDQNIIALANKGTTSILNFENQQPHKHFDSFIFGSSLTISTPCDEWLKYLPEGSRPFHFDASAMNIEQMCQYMEYLTAHADVRNAYIITDPHLLNTDPPTCPSSPLVAYQKDLINVKYLNGFRYWLSFNGSIGLNAAIHTGNLSWVLDYTNIYHYRVADNQEFYLRRPEFFNWLDSLSHISIEERMVMNPPRIMKPFLHGKKLDLLKRFADILSREGTDYRLVLISTAKTDGIHRPLHLAPADSVVMREIFGDRFISAQWLSLPWSFDTVSTFDNFHFTDDVAVRLLDYVYGDSVRNTQPAAL